MIKQFLLFLNLSLLISISAFADQSNLYDFKWLDEDKNVFVLQNKLFPKKNTFYLNVGYLRTVEKEFEDTAGFRGEIGYFFTEEWGIELFYNRYSNSDNDQKKNLASVTDTEPFVRSFDSTFGAMAIWSPFYGKINTFNKIFYFDVSFGLGIASISGQSNLSAAAGGATATTNRIESESYEALTYKAQFTLHVTRQFHVGLAFINSHYQAPGPRDVNTDKWNQNTDMVLSVGLSF